MLSRRIETLFKSSRVKRVMFEKITKKVRPSVEEERALKKRVNGFLKEVKKHTKEAKPVVGGSFGKGTWLSGKHDVDVFLVFKDEEDISEKTGMLLKKAFKDVERVHGSRDYFVVKEKGSVFEVIPVVRIRRAKEAKNMTDVSLLHVGWVKKRLNKKLADQVRLAKKFFRAQKVYGAETFIRGFSGYVVEILIIYYGSFLELLKHALHWKKGMMLDPSGHGVDINKHKGAALILVDPVQPVRNAAAGVSEERFDRLVKACRKFVQRPAESWFEEKEISWQGLKEKDIVLEVIPLEGKADVVGTKMVKAFEEIKNCLKKEGFGVVDADWEWNERAFFWFTVKNKELEKKYKHFGPPLKMKEHVAVFKKEYKKVGVENDRMFVWKVRKHTGVKEFVKALINDKKIVERVKFIIIKHP